MEWAPGAARPSWARAAAVAIGFLTRLPVFPKGEIDARTFGRAVAWFPLAGALLGGLLFLAHRAVAGHLPATVQGVGLVALLAWLSGGLHLDGLADVFDGLSGGHGDRARMLEIMRDSRIGAHGAAALLLALLVKAAALAEVLGRGGDWALIAFPAVGRLGVSAAMLIFPRVTARGLGASFNREARPGYLALGATTVAAVLAAARFGFGAGVLDLLVPVAAALVLALAFAARVSRLLGGLTGDVYGACVELAEVVFLVAAAWR